MGPVVAVVDGTPIHDWYVTADDRFFRFSMVVNTEIASEEISPSQQVLYPGLLYEEY